MRRTVSLALVSGALIALAATLVSGSTRQTAVADEGCSNQSLRGAYGFAIDGQAFGANGQEAAEFADAGRIVFDGHGGLNGTDTESLNGLITTGLTFSGAYSVQAACTGTAVISGGITANLRFMLVEGGQEVNVIDTDPGLVAAGQISKQQLAGCTNANFKGVYSFATTGSFFAPGATGPAEAGDVAAFGRIVADGRGNTTEDSAASFNGLQSADTQTGTYTVNPDCTGSATSTHHPSGQVDQVNFVIVERGAEAKFIVTNPGAVFTGTVDRQPIEGD
jgi:hypothetical protein